MEKNIILFDDDGWKDLLPLTYTRPISELRVGILTIREKWAKLLGGNTSYITNQDYLTSKYPIHITDDNLVINARLLPDARILSLIKKMEPKEAILYENEWIAARMDNKQFEQLINNQETEELKGTNITQEQHKLILLKGPYDIFSYNGEEIVNDFALLTKGKYSKSIPSGVTVTDPTQIFIEETATLNACHINTTTGPVYIGKNVEIMEGSLIRGPFAACDNAVVKMGAKIYGKTTLGPYSKVGGELNNVVIQGYSNKGHDGFLGNSVLGEWCNLGADTNNSNLKNNYAEVKLWNYNKEGFAKTGLTFCGLIMGDHSKAGINTMFNTGTVVGVSANIYGSGFPRNFVPSFSWGGREGFKTYRFDKAMEVAEIVMARRKKELEEEDRKILEHVFNTSAQYRNWES